jgi:hypothetical protein
VHSRVSSIHLLRINSTRKKGHNKSASANPNSSNAKDDALGLPREGMYGDIKYADGSRGAKSVGELTNKVSDGQVNGEVGGMTQQEDQKIEMPTERNEQQHAEGNIKAAILKKLQLHKA